ncbi:MAG: SGNH/GDSL hydrolase family protein [Mycobacteriales bacterium]
MAGRLSIVVLGNSLTFLQTPQRRRRDQGTYGEVLQELLAQAGVEADMHLEGRWFDFIDKGLGRYQESVRSHQPDVLIVQYGLNESQPWLAPVWLIRHLTTRHQTVTPLALWYRRVVAGRVWRVLRAYRRAASPRVGTRTWQMTPQRFAGKLQKLISNVRIELKPLVLVLDITAPGPLLTHFLPGMEERHALYQQVIRRVVDGFDSAEVRLVEVSKVVDELGFEVAAPDSMHFSVVGHRRVGELLAAEVLSWLQATPPRC